MEIMNSTMDYLDLRHSFHIFNSQAVGRNLWIPLALKSIFWVDLIFESAPWFIHIILKFIFTPIFEVRIHENKFVDTKKNHFRRPIFTLNLSFFLIILKFILTLIFNI